MPRADKHLKWNDGIGTQICEILATGKTIMFACSEAGISYATLRRKRDPKSIYYDADFAAGFESAMLDSSYILADEAVEAATDKSGDYFENVGKNGNIYSAPNSANVQRHKLIADMKIKQAQIRNKKFRLNDQTTLNNTVVPYTVTNFGDKKKNDLSQDGAMQKHISVLEKIRATSNN
jgi:hypothetical protein